MRRRQRNGGYCDNRPCTCYSRRCTPWHFQNLKAIPREIYGVKILYGAEVNILDLEGNIDLADEVLENLTL